MERVKIKEKGKEKKDPFPREPLKEIKKACPGRTGIKRRRHKL